MKKQYKIIFLLAATVLGTCFFTPIYANTAMGHATIGLAVLIDMTENPGSYSNIESETKDKLLSVEDFQLQKDKNGNYQVRFEQLNSVQQAFLSGCIAPDDYRINGFLDNWHYVDPQGRIDSIFKKAENEANQERAKMDYAYGYGTKSHILSDWMIHPILPQVLQGPSKERVEAITDPFRKLDYWTERGFHWKHIILEREFDYDGYDENYDANRVSIVALRNQLVNMHPGKLRESDVNDLIGSFAHTRRISFQKGMDEPIEPIQKYDVHQANNDYYRDIYMKCSKCEKVLDMIRDRTTRDDGDFNMTDNLQWKDRDDSELRNYARLVLKVVQDYRRALEKQEVRELWRIPPSPLDPPKLPVINYQEIENQANLILSRPVPNPPTEETARQRDQDKQQLDRLTSNLWISVRVDHKRREKLAGLNLGSYLADHRNQLVPARLSIAKDLDDNKILPVPYHLCCDCDDSDSHQNPSSDIMKPPVSPKDGPNSDDKDDQNTTADIMSPPVSPKDDTDSKGQGTKSSGARPPRKGLFTVPGYDVGN